VAASTSAMVRGAAASALATPVAASMAARATMPRRAG